MLAQVNNMLKRDTKRKIRQKRVRSKITGLEKKPRLSVFRSSNHIYAQVINDEIGKTLISFDDKNIKKGNKVEKAFEVGKNIAEKSIAEKITEVVFDRAGYKYHGRVKSLAEGARKGGLKF